MLLPPRRPFDMLRACFWLLAIIMLLEMFATLLGGFLCWWINYTTVRQPGGCTTVTVVIREIWQELVTAILALLLAARNLSTPDPPDKGKDKNDAENHDSDPGRQ